MQDRCEHPVLQELGDLTQPTTASLTCQSDPRPGRLLLARRSVSAHLHLTDPTPGGTP